MGSSARLQSLTLRAKGLELPNGLVLDSVEVDSGPATFDTEAGGVALGQPAALVARLGPASLQRFLAGRLPAAVRDVAVAFQAGEIGVLARAQMIVSVQVAIRLALRLESASQVHVAVLDVEPGLARALVEEEVAKANPVFDAAELPFPTQLESVEVGADAVVLRARVPGYPA